jgi:HAD superfamily hydrolase (TIGR01490 family)
MAARARTRSRAAAAGWAAAAAAEVEASLTIPPDPTVAAFFDVDNTMMQGASIYYFARGLAARKFFTWRDLSAFAWKQAVFRLRGVEDPAHMDEAKQAALAFIAGHAVDEVVGLGEEIYDELMAERIWSGTRALAQLHLDAGQRVWLVTAAPIELATLVARRLGLTGALGTVSEIEEGAYTGRLVGEPLHGPAKAEAIRALAEQQELDLEQCSAYSDSANDLPMLSVVGHPVAVNPDARLKKIARQRGWDIRDFRTGRKAARVGVPAAAGTGALAGGIAVGLAMHRRHNAPVRRARRRARQAGRALRRTF